MKKIALIGSTGSIGRQTLEVIQMQQGIEVVALAANTNIALLEQQIMQYHPKIVCVYDQKAAKQLQQKIDQKTKIVTGMDGLLECVCTEEVTLVVMALVGMIGIQPTIEAIRKGKNIALANKETLVTAGHLIMPLAKEHGVSILPIDSEHAAIFQCLHGEKKEQINQILLTASGGPFRGKTKEELQTVTKQQALAHPNWAMGQKITVDSATMMNKGLEVIEAKWLFDVSVDQIVVVVQPQSIIHSMVSFIDGAVIAQMGLPDMKIPIQYALYYPERKKMKESQLDFFSISNITFEKPDQETFLPLAFAYEAARKGGSLPTALNAANEKAVEKFLKEEISFLDIMKILETVMAVHQWKENPSISDILEIEKQTHAFVESRW